MEVVCEAERLYLPLVGARLVLAALAAPQPRPVLVPLSSYVLVPEVPQRTVHHDVAQVCEATDSADEQCADAAGGDAIEQPGRSEVGERDVGHSSRGQVHRDERSERSAERVARHHHAAQARVERQQPLRLIEDCVHDSLLCGVEALVDEPSGTERQGGALDVQVAEPVAHVLAAPEHDEHLVRGPVHPHEAVGGGGGVQQLQGGDEVSRCRVVEREVTRWGTVGLWQVIMNIKITLVQ